MNVIMANKFQNNMKETKIKRNGNECETVEARAKANKKNNVRAAAPTMKSISNL